MNKRRNAGCRRFCIQLVLLLIVESVCARQATAQRVVHGIAGLEYRSAGDTTWQLRDTVMTREVYHGDTVTVTRFVNERMTGSTTYVRRGAGAVVIALRDTAGVLQSPGVGRVMASWSAVTTARMGRERAIQFEEMVARLPSRAALTPRKHPAVTSTYPLSANTNIYQLGDTVRYIHGCAAALPTDTTVYVLYAPDSVRRRSPDTRTFGPLMVDAIVSDMAQVLTSQSVKKPDNLAIGLPGLRKWPCDLR